MSSWSARLEHVDGEGLAHRPVAKAAEPGATHERGDEDTHRNYGCPALARNTAVTLTSAALSTSTPTLDELRDRIVRIVGHRHATRDVCSDVPPSVREGFDDPVDLGFVAEPCALGLLHSRHRRFSAHRVGRSPVGAGATASMQMVALLALDPSLAGLDPTTALYFDVETSGLATGAGTVAFLVGLGYFEMVSDGSDGVAFVVEQLLLRQPGEEAPLLARIATLMERASMLVSYNGKTFDLPLLKTRFVMNRLPIPAVKPHVDLLHVARRVHGHRLAQRALARVESEVLGFVRLEDVPSAEIPARYFHFLRTGDEQALAQVVEHNVADVLSMGALMGVYGEPLEGLSPIDLVGVARTLRRARSLDLAHEFAERAIDGGAGVEGVRVRAEIARTRGDKVRALADFEVLVDSVDDPTVRLALAKLYEHHAKEPLRALQLLARGTGESPDAEEKRRRGALRSRQTDLFRLADL